MTEGEGSPRPWTGSGAECICKDEDQDVLLPGWLSLADCTAPPQEGANSRGYTNYVGT